MPPRSFTLGDFGGNCFKCPNSHESGYVAIFQLAVGVFVEVSETRVKVLFAFQSDFIFFKHQTLGIRFFRQRGFPVQHWSTGFSLRPRSCDCCGLKNESQESQPPKGWTPARESSDGLLSRSIGDYTAAPLPNLKSLISIH